MDKWESMVHEAEALAHAMLDAHDNPGEGRAILLMAADALHAAIITEVAKQVNG